MPSSRPKPLLARNQLEKPLRLKPATIGQSPHTNGPQCPKYKELKAPAKLKTPRHHPATSRQPQPCAAAKCHQRNTICKPRAPQTHHQHLAVKQITGVAQQPATGGHERVTRHHHQHPTTTNSPKTLHPTSDAAHHKPKGREPETKGSNVLAAGPTGRQAEEGATNIAAHADLYQKRRERERLPGGVIFQREKGERTLLVKPYSTKNKRHWVEEINNIEKHGKKIASYKSFKKG